MGCSSGGSCGVTCPICYGTGSIDSAENSLAISPAALFFGTLVVTESLFQPQAVRVTNNTGAPVEIEHVRITVGGDYFTLAGNQAYPDILVHGAYFDVEVVPRQVSTMGQIAGLLEIRCNDQKITHPIGLSARVVGSETWDNVLQSITDDFQALIDEERWVRSTAISAEAGSRLLLGASLSNQISASILEERMTRVTQFQAEALERELLEARVLGQMGDLIEAAVYEETVARSNQYGSIASRVTGLEATYVDVNALDDTRAILNARIETEEQARVGLYGALASRLDTLEVTFEDFENDDSVLTFVQARIQEESTARADADDALAERTSVLEATVAAGPDLTAVNARIENEEIARANADEALAERTLLLEAAVEAGPDLSLITARIEAEEIARADGDEALAERTALLEAAVEAGPDLSSVIARIETEEQARADADSALADRTSVLEAAVAGGVDTSAIVALIEAEETARIQGDQAEASARQTLATTVGNNTASIQSQQTVLNGLTAKYSLKLNVNGHITGYELNSNGTTGSFAILATSFSIIDPGQGAGATPVTVFEVSGGQVRIRNPVIGSLNVNTGNIAPSAVTSVLSTVRTDVRTMPISSSPTSGFQGASVTLSNPSGGFVRIDFASSFIAMGSNGAGQIEFPLIFPQLWRTQNGVRTQIINTAAYGTNTGFVVDTPQAGVAATYQIEYFVSNAVVSTSQLMYEALLISEFKR